MPNPRVYLVAAVMWDTASKFRMAEMHMGLRFIGVLVLIPLYSCSSAPTYGEQYPGQWQPASFRVLSVLSAGDVNGCQHAYQKANPLATSKLIVACERHGRVWSGYSVNLESRAVVADERALLDFGPPDYMS